MKFLKTFIFAATAVLMVGFLASCDNQNKTEAGEAINSAGKEMEREMSELKVQLNDSKTKLDTRIDRLENDLEAASDDAKDEIKQQIDKLEAERKEVSKALDNFGDNAKKNWKEFKSGVNKTLNDVERDLKD